MKIFSTVLLLICFHNALAAETVETDKAALLMFKGSNDNSYFNTWNASTDPCSTECWEFGLKYLFYPKPGCWYQVTCTGPSPMGRVKTIKIYTATNHMTDQWNISSNIEALAPLTKLEVLDLQSAGRRLHGDIASLSGLVSLQTLKLPACSVHGNLTNLGTLKNLTEAKFSGTNIFGDVEKLYEVMGVDISKSSERRKISYDGCADLHYRSYFYDHITGENLGYLYGTSCEDRGLIPRPEKYYAGRDECACCLESSLTRDKSTGVCSNRLWGRWIQTEECAANLRCENCCNNCTACAACAACAVCNGKLTMGSSRCAGAQFIGNKCNYEYGLKIEDNGRCLRSEYAGRYFQSDGPCTVSINGGEAVIYISIDKSSRPFNIHQDDQLMVGGVALKSEDKDSGIMMRVDSNSNIIWNALSSRGGGNDPTKYGWRLCLGYFDNSNTNQPTNAPPPTSAPPPTTAPAPTTTLPPTNQTQYTPSTGSQILPTIIIGMMITILFMN